MEHLYIARTEYWISYITISCVRIFSACRSKKNVILSIKKNKINYGEENTKDGGRGNKKAAVRNEGKRREVLRGVRVKRIRRRLHPLKTTSSTNTTSVSPMTVCVGRFASCFKCQSQHGVGELAFLRDSIIDSVVAWLGKRATVYTYHRQPSILPFLFSVGYEATRKATCFRILISD